MAGKAGHGRARHGKAGQGMAGLGRLWQARRGAARLGRSWQAGQGAAWQGWAGQIMAGVGFMGNKMTDDELRAAIAGIPYFYHRIELRPGITTPGWAPIDESAYKIPDSMRGEFILDVGAWDGFFSFLALKRGAEFVQAIDDFSDTLGSIDNVDRSDAWKTFDLCAGALNIAPARFDRREMGVYDVRQLGQRFDRIFCFGLLYHLRHPLYALERLHRVCSGTIHIETAILDDCQSAYSEAVYDSTDSAFEFYPNSEYGMNSSNWWVGTLKAWCSLIEAAGFRSIESWKLTDTPRQVSEARGFIRAEA